MYWHDVQGQQSFVIPARRLCAEGRSAGGLTMGAVVTMRPDLVNAVLMGVPFVDIVTTMLDATIPLTTIEVRLHCSAGPCCSGYSVPADSRLGARP